MAAIQLVSVNQERKQLHVNAEAANLLRQNFANASPNVRTEIIGIVGQARLGKSTALNFLLEHFRDQNDIKQDEIKHAGGFEARISARSITEGVWLWTKPLQISETRSIVLLDCQGAGLGDENLNLQIISLAFMLCGLVIVNVDGAPLNDENITLLNLVQNFCQKMDLGGRALLAHEFFPTLLFRSRDVREQDLQVDFPGVNVNDAALDAKFNNDLLRPTPDALIDHAKRELCRCFARRHWCTTLPPSAQDDTLLDMGRLPSAASPFGLSMQRFVSRVLSLSRPKNFGGANISVPLLLDQLNAIVEALPHQRFYLPSVIDALQGQQEESCALRAIHAYKELWNDVKDFVSYENLQHHHEHACEVARGTYVDELKARGLGTLANLERLNTRLTAELLPFQERLHQQMCMELKTLQDQAAQDETKRVALQNDIDVLRSQVSSLGSQLHSLQEENARQERRVQEAERDHHREEGRGGSSCVLL